jgi:alpha-2-macroglobulin-like protein
MFTGRTTRLGFATVALLGISAALVARQAPPASSADRFLAHVSSDKPIYRAGERVYLRGVILGANDHKPLPVDVAQQAMVRINGPKGELIANLYSTIEDSVAAAYWDVPDESAGGEYTATITFPWTGFPPSVRKFDVRAYRAPRLKGEIIFLRDGFGPGDTVKASLHVERAEGGLPSGANVNVSAIVDGADAHTSVTKIDPQGNVSVEFKLPANISRGDGTLALAITDGGVVETIAKTIPILLKTVDVSFYPEGGDLIAGLANRVYVEARTTTRKPADLVGAVVDSTGNEVATLRTEHEGRGRVTFTPKAGEKYSLKLSQPAGIDKQFDLPAVRGDGVGLASDADVIAKGETIKLRVASTSEGSYTVTLAKRATEVASVTTNVVANETKVVELTPPSWADGVLVATVKDKSGKPLAERLVFRRPARAINVKVVADKSKYVPAGSASLTVTTTDEDGKPIGTVVGITATDESVLRMIEKRERAPRLGAMVFLENDVRELADAEVYLDPNDPQASLATDLLLGTQGWRRFATADQTKFLAEFADEARRVLADRQPVVVTRTALARNVDFAAVNGAALPPAMPEGAAGARREADDLVNDKLGVEKKEAASNRAKDVSDRKQVLQKRIASGGRGLAAAESPARRLDMDVAGEEFMPMQQLAAPVPPVRIFAHDLSPDRKPDERDDFTETLYWCAGVKTDEKTGTANISFKLNDAVSSFKVTADAFDNAGALGGGEVTLASVKPFYVEPKIPLEVSTGDTIRLPIAAVNGTDGALEKVRLSIGFGSPVSPLDPFALGANGRERRVTDLRVMSVPQTANLVIKADAGTYSDTVTRPVVVKPRGFPTEIAYGGLLDANAGVSHTIDVPESLVPGSMTTTAALFPTPVGNLTEALAGLMREPSGCFEQTSSTTYPLTMAQQYFLTHSGVDPALVARSGELLAKGYERLKSFECTEKGYEWFGSNPGHECLSAFGLLHFTDLAQVREVDQAMVANTRKWLLARRDGTGQFKHERRALHTWIVDPGCANGYITWALLECGERDLVAEVKWIKERAQADDNSYVTALAANVMHLAGDHGAARSLMDKLAKLQDKDGHVNGAKTTVVGSGGSALQIETTALATLAWLREPSYVANVERAIGFLAESCKAGRYGSTQSTVLALRAIVAYDKARAHPAAAGTVQLVVDDQPVGEPIAFTSESKGAIKLPDISDKLAPGKHTLALKMADGSTLPYAMSVSFNSVTPASSDECKLRIATTLKDEQVDEGAITEALVTVTNTADEVVPTPIAIVGLPGGLEVRHDQLKELVKSQRIAAYEVRGREVVLYWREMQSKAAVEIPLSLTAAVPGTYTGPASRAYLYYTDEFKQWAQGMSITIAAR